jgi:hypothetical protein
MTDHDVKIERTNGGNIMIQSMVHMHVARGTQCNY